MTGALAAAPKTPTAVSAYARKKKLHLDGVIWTFHISSDIGVAVVTVNVSNKFSSFYDFPSGPQVHRRESPSVLP